MLIFDDHGGEPALSTAEHLVGRGSQVAIVTADRLVGHDVVGTLYPAYLTAFYRGSVRLTPDLRRREVSRHHDGLAAVLQNEYTGDCTLRVVDHVVLEHGTIPNDDLYVDLRDQSTNRGEIEIDALIRGEPQRLTTNPHGRYRLFRIGDAVESRDVHAAIYDARRIALTI